MSCWYVYSRGNGEFIFIVNFPANVVNRHSQVVASICEVSGPVGGTLDYPFIGAARMAICNVAPRDDNKVQFWVKIDWNSPLNYKINIIIC